MPSPSSAPFLLRAITDIDDDASWSDLWRCLQAETLAASRSDSELDPDPTIEGTPGPNDPNERSTT